MRGMSGAWIAGFAESFPDFLSGARDVFRERDFVIHLREHPLANRLHIEMAFQAARGYSRAGG